jgi:hypothetical protein
VSEYGAATNARKAINPHNRSVAIKNQVGLHAISMMGTLLSGSRVT